MKYIYIYGDDFGFKDSEINDILETDIEISEEIYDIFFEEQSKGKKLKIKDIHGNSFEEIFEEIPPETPQKREPTILEILSLENDKLRAELAKSKLEIDLAFKKIQAISNKE